jgi:hypothetical protein
MRTWKHGACWGIALALILGGTAFGKSPLLPKKEEATCGDYGTSVHFEDTPVEAAKQAKKDGKLVLILHISGHFEDPGLT